MTRGRTSNLFLGFFCLLDNRVEFILGRGFEDLGGHTGLVTGPIRPRVRGLAVTITAASSGDVHRLNGHLKSVYF